MKVAASNLKKRKLLIASVEDSCLRAPKHVCCEEAVRSECNPLSSEALNTEDVEVDDTLVESNQDSNNFPAESQSSAEVIFDALIHKSDLSDEASTSWANSRSVTSRNDSFSFESRISSGGDGMEVEEFHPPSQQDTGWHDIDYLEECFDAHQCKDSKQQAVGELEGLLSSSGVNMNLYTLSSERGNVDQEARMGRQKQTIDEEFEQYFSTLML